MKAVYPTYLTTVKDAILVEVPDLEILTQGTNLNNAIEMARDAIAVKIVTMEDAGETVPSPSTLSSLQPETGTFNKEGPTILSLVDVDSFDYRRKTETRTVRRNVALPSWLDYAAEKSGINVSRVLQDALINILGIQNKN